MAERINTQYIMYNMQFLVDFIFFFFFVISFERIPQQAVAVRKMLCIGLEWEFCVRPTTLRDAY